MIAVIAVSCSNSDDHANPQAEVRVAETEQLSVITTAPTLQATASEQEAFKVMMEKYSDGGLTGEELELFALEAVQCTQRAGYELELHDFNTITGNATFGSDAGDDPDVVTPNVVAGDRCLETFYLQALTEFDRTNGPSEAERLAEEAREAAVLLDCFAAAGFEHSDPHVALQDPQVPDDVRTQCLLAYGR